VHGGVRLSLRRALDSALYAAQLLAYKPIGTSVCSQWRGEKGASTLLFILYFFSQALNFAPFGFRCAQLRMAFFTTLFCRLLLRVPVIKKLQIVRIKGI